jgi:hypothetical protein
MTLQGFIATSDELLKKATCFVHKLEGTLERAGD